MIRWLTWWIIAAPVMATPLGKLLDSLPQNETLQARSASTQAYEYERQHIDSRYLPSLSSRFQATYNAHNSPMEAMRTYQADVILTYPLFDGWTHDALITQAQSRIDESRHTLSWEGKTLTLSLIETYGAILSLQAQVHALEDEHTLIDAQIARLNHFFSAGLTTRETVQKLTAQQRRSDLTLLNQRHQITNLLHTLALLSHHEHIESVEPFDVVEPDRTHAQREDLLTLTDQHHRLEGALAELKGLYYPRITLEGVASYYRYGDDPIPYFHIQDQQRLLINAQWQWWDWGVRRHQHQSLQAQKLALQYHQSYQQRLVSNRIDESARAQDVARDRIRSAQAILDATLESFSFVEKRFQNGLASNVEYLDALRERSEAIATYEQAKIESQLATIRYYATLGIDPKEVIR